MTSKINSDTSITEEELKRKQVPITINDIFRLRKSTNNKNMNRINYLFSYVFVGYLTETDENVFSNS